MAHIRQALMLLFAALLLTSAFAQTNQEEQLRQSCLARNPEHRQIWDWRVDSTAEGGGVGGRVDVFFITPDRVGKCFQIDCIEEAFDTDRLFQYCDDRGARYKFYNVTYQFPVCEPVYNEMIDYQQDAICERCEPAQILTPYVHSTCQNDREVLSREIKVFLGPNCQERQFTEFKVTNDSCAMREIIGILLFVAIIIGAWAFVTGKIKV